MMDENDYNTTNDNIDGGGSSGEASEPPGEGDGDIVIIADKDGNSVDGGGGQCVDFHLLLFC